ncbi:MAG: bifunctional isocitrate dehydrogenase kinase/phosphatase [Lewinella sp.]|nr:bifunctional isocitrate dehydrogenase kinase/phosphatase [Lewinella sp.]
MNPLTPQPQPLLGSKDFEKLIPYEAASIVLEAYVSYYSQYKRITKRAKIRFEQRDWHGIQADSRERILLYRERVGAVVKTLLQFLGERAGSRELWLETKANFAEEIANFNTRNIAETFYNSVFRHAHHGQLGKDDQLMFVYGTGSYREFRSREPIFHTLYLTGPLEIHIRQLMAYFPFDTPMDDPERDMGYIIRRLEEWQAKSMLPNLPLRLEVLKSVFFRNKAAYIVGRLVQTEKPTPFVISLLQGSNGLVVDTLLLDEPDVSTIFSYNRSYFLVDVDIVSDTVDFLRTILPTKNLGELYNSIGFEKHGKTVFYRELERHMMLSQDKFDFTPGIKGMVMTVFNLSSYNMVFKVIKDKFAPPKQVTYQEVVDRYELVNRHDRVGRMADSYLFERLSLPLRRIAKPLLKELQEDCPSKIEIKDGKLILKHLYVEKKMVPLNLYLEEASPEEARDAINEYGKAIKEMAAVNIFPGDMLLKNSGVTRLGRVVFYDYDEIGFLTDYNFRRIPPPRDYYEEMSSEPYYTVGEWDVFPEEFPKFLVGNPQHRQWMSELHGDLFDVTFWHRMQERLRKGEIVKVFPYRRRLAFKYRYGGEERPPYFQEVM